MKSYSSREVLKILKKHGWQLDRIYGSHHQFKHPDKQDLVTVAHPTKDLPRRTLDRIEEQSGLQFR